MKLKVWVVLFFIIFLISSFPRKVYAAFSFNIESVSLTSINSVDQEVTVDVSLSNLPNPSYFRAEFQKSAGKTYFGYSKDNNNNWIPVNSSEDCKNYYYVSDTGTASLVLLTKIGTDFQGDNGTYTIKVRHYTQSCLTTDDSDPVSIEITLPTPQPTIEPTPSPAPTSTPDKTSSTAPTPTPKSSTPTPRPLVKVSGTPSSTPSILAAKNSSTPLVLSEEVSSNEQNPSPIKKLLLIAGVGILLISSWPIVAKITKRYNGKDVSASKKSH